MTETVILWFLSLMLCPLPRLVSSALSDPLHVWLFPRLVTPGDLVIEQATFLVHPYYYTSMVVRMLAGCIPVRLHLAGHLAGTSILIHKHGSAHVGGPRTSLPCGVPALHCCAQRRPTQSQSSLASSSAPVVQSQVQVQIQSQIQIQIRSWIQSRARQPVLQLLP